MPKFSDLLGTGAARPGQASTYRYTVAAQNDFRGLPKWKNREKISASELMPQYSESS